MTEQPSNCTDCPEYELDEITAYWISNFILPLVGSCGIVGNILAVIVLLSPFMRTTTFHQSLLFLVICDILFLMMTLADNYINPSNKFYVIMFPYFWYPVKQILLSWETYLIMAISTERWLAVCKPFWHRTNSLSTSSMFHLMIFILPSFIIALILNVPKWLEFEHIFENTTSDSADGGNVTEAVLDYGVTQLRHNPDYIFYYTHLTRLLCTGLIPFVYLASLNISICSTIRKSSQLQMPNSKSSCRYTLCLHGSHEDSPEYPASNTDTSLTSTPSIDNRGHKMTSMKSRSSLHPPPTIRKSSNNSSKCMKHPAKLNVNKNCSSSSKNSVATLLVIVIMYLLCNIPRLTLNTAEYLLRDLFNGLDDCECTQVYLMIDKYYILISDFQGTRMDFYFDEHQSSVSDNQHLRQFCHLFCCL